MTSEPIAFSAADGYALRGTLLVAGRARRARWC